MKYFRKLESPPIKGRNTQSNLFRYLTNNGEIVSRRLPFGTDCSSRNPYESRVYAVDSSTVKTTIIFDSKDSHKEEYSFGIEIHSNKRKPLERLTEDLKKIIPGLGCRQEASGPLELPLREPFDVTP